MKKIIILAAAALLLAACDAASNACYTDDKGFGHPHAWGPWSAVQSDGSYNPKLYQTRSCEKCNVAESRFVK
jgi:hypothetical protein